MTTGDVPASRIVIDNPAAGVRVVAFDRPEVRNAFDTTMYLQVTEALVEADRDETVSAIILTGRGSAFTSGQDLAEMAAMATGTAVEGAGQGFMGLLDCHDRALRAHVGRRERRRRGAGIHRPGPL